MMMMMHACRMVNCIEIKLRRWRSTICDNQSAVL